MKLKKTGDINDIREIVEKKHIQLLPDLSYLIALGGLLLDSVSATS
jgi:hypothetical protein